MLRSEHIVPKIFLLLIFLSNQVHSQSWEKIETLPSIWMTACFAHENTLWVAGSDKLYFYSDESYEWDSTAIINPQLQFISDIIIHENIIYVTDEFEGIFKSEDWGLSWKDFNQGLTFKYIKSGEIRGNNIYIATIGAGIFVRNLHSNQGWQPFSSGIFWKNSESITAISTTLVAGVGHNSTLYLNEVNEANWTEISFTNFNGLPSALLSIIEVNDTWIAAGNNGLYKSFDKGKQWTQLNILTGHNGQARLVYHNNVVFAHLSNNSGSSKLFYSEDFGVTWNIFSPSISDGFELIFWNNTMWYATIKGLWKLETSTGIDSEHKIAPGIKAYPNPFESELKLDLLIKSPGHYKIELQSIANSRSFIIKNNWMETGTHEISLDTLSSMPSGIYILKVTSGSLVSSFKLYKTE